MIKQAEIVDGLQPGKWPKAEGLPPATVGAPQACGRVDKPVRDKPCPGKS